VKKYEILEHKADLKIRAFGRTKEKLFQNMLLGMSENQKAEIKNTKEIKREIKIKSLDLPSLLIDFLSEVLYLSQTNREVYNNVNFKKFTNKKIEGGLIGQRVEKFREDIKAVTYHNLEVHQKGDKTWEAIVLFDL